MRAPTEYELDLDEALGYVSELLKPASLQSKVPWFAFRLEPVCRGAEMGTNQSPSFSRLPGKSRTNPMLALHDYYKLTPSGRQALKGFRQERIRFRDGVDRVVSTP